MKKLTTVLMVILLLTFVVTSIHAQSNWFSPGVYTCENQPGFKLKISRDGEVMAKNGYGDVGSGSAAFNNADKTIRITYDNGAVAFLRYVSRANFIEDATGETWKRASSQRF